MAKTTRWDPARYARDAAFVAELGEPLIDLLAPEPGELVLDLGCGDGALSHKILLSGAAVVGADSSIAQARAAKRRGLEVVAMDAHRFCLKRRFDAVFTNAALHWMARPQQVVRETAACLKAGGRFVGEFGGRGNVETVRSALHLALGRRGIAAETVDPWYYPAVDEYSKLLSDAGFDVPYAELISRPTKLPGELVVWLEIFAQPFIDAVPENERKFFVDEICAQTRGKLSDREGAWRLDYVRLRFAAVKN